MDAEARQERWESRWKGGIAPGQAWDMTCPSPALVALCEASHELALPAGRALVPGMGRGYASVALAMDGRRDVVGLDISVTGVAEAQAHLDGLEGAARPKGAVSYVHGDFFQHAFEEPFAVVYDYTFLCALPPALREAWAKRHFELLAPGGVLVTMVFPICDKEDGPPYAMSLELVASLCTAAGFEQRLLTMLPHAGLDPHQGRNNDGGHFAAGTGLGLWVKPTAV